VGLVSEVAEPDRLAIGALLGARQARHELSLHLPITEPIMNIDEKSLYNLCGEIEPIADVLGIAVVGDDYVDGSTVHIQCRVNDARNLTVG